MLEVFAQRALLQRLKRLRKKLPVFIFTFGQMALSTYYVDDFLRLRQV